MIKIKIVGGDHTGWSIDEDKKNIIYFLKKIKNFKLTKNIFKADVYFFVWYNQLLYKKYFIFSVLKKIFNKKIIAVVTNDILLNDLDFNKIRKKVDLWISPNKKISNFLKENEIDFFELPFYVSNKKFYKLNLCKEDILKKIGVDYLKIKNKTLIGSFQRDSLSSDLNKPKWQKDPDFLVKIAKKLPNNFLWVLAGPRRHYLINEFKKNNINFIFVGDENFIENNKDDINHNNLSKEKINYLYNLIDFYVVSSKSESGPKAILESCLAKTLIFSTDVGLAKDFLFPNLIIKNENDFIKKIEKINEVDINKIIEFNYEKVINILDENKYLKSIENIFKRI